LDEAALRLLDTHRGVELPLAGRLNHGGMRHGVVLSRMLHNVTGVARHDHHAIVPVSRHSVANVRCWVVS